MVNLKELKKLVKYLRQEGITEFKSDGMEFKLGDKPVSPKARKVDTEASQTIQDAIDSDYPTPDEMLFYSVGGGAPKEDS